LIIICTPARFQTKGDISIIDKSYLADIPADNIDMAVKNFFSKLVVFPCIFLVFCFFLLLGAFVFPAEAQEAGSALPGAAELPRTFRQLALGMPLEDLKTGLKNDGLFNFRGDRDVSFLPAREQSLVETTGRSFVRRAFFQLRDGELFIMSFSLNTSMVDHYSIFTSMVAKYGEPSFLDPKQAVWESEDTRIAIERPLTVKYIDKRVFNDIIDESDLVESTEVKKRQEFIDEF
jgi:hypothetical protein